MRTLIIYATKYGATKIIAESIASHLEDADILDISSSHNPKISDYDCIVLGSPLTAGTIRKEIKEFANKYADELKSKNLGLYVSGLQASGEAEYFEQNFSSVLLETAKVKAFLGGIFDPEKCGFLARTAIKIITKLDRYTSTIDEEKIKLFAQNLKN